MFESGGDQPLTLAKLLQMLGGGSAGTQLPANLQMQAPTGVLSNGGMLGNSGSTGVSPMTSTMPTNGMTNQMGVAGIQPGTQQGQSGLGMGAGMANQMGAHLQQPNNLTGNATQLGASSWNNGGQLGGGMYKPTGAAIKPFAGFAG